VLAVDRVDERLDELERLRGRRAAAGLDARLDQRYGSHHQKRTTGVNDQPVKASKLETLGAWLGLWTPPRDVVVPPVPWGKVALAAAGLAVAIAAFAVFAAPAIDDAKDERSAREERELAERAAQRRERMIRLQAPRYGRAPGSASRRAVVATLSEDIGRDARRRFSPKAATATCTIFPGLDPTQRRVAYRCLSATSIIDGGGDQEGARGQLGYPYRAVVDFATNRYAFCRVNPRPSEKAINDPRKLVQLPAACLLTREEAGAVD
jgi:hypothetical protein